MTEITAKSIDEDVYKRQGRGCAYKRNGALDFIRYAALQFLLVAPLLRSSWRLRLSARASIGMRRGYGLSLIHIWPVASIAFRTCSFWARRKPRRAIFPYATARTRPCRSQSRNSLLKFRRKSPTVRRFAFCGVFAPRHLECWAAVHVKLR